MLQEILSAEALWFWTLILAQSLLVVWFVRNDNLVGSVLSVLSIIAGFGFFPGQWESIGLGQLQREGFWPFINQNGGMILGSIGCYVLLGLVWAAFRWWLFVKDLREQYDRRKADWLEPKSLLNTAQFLRAQAACHEDEGLRQRYSHWANACADAAARGGQVLNSELKPVWKDFVEHGYRF